MYDSFSADYDRFVDWDARLAAELPFIERQLQDAGASRVLDAACGTGMHTIALARKGYDVAGADLSTGMIGYARANAVAAGVEARFAIAGFGELAGALGDGFDALLCLGNSLPHLLSTADLAAAMVDFAACLRPGGLVLIQNRNFDRVLSTGERWMEPQAHRSGEQEWLFVRCYDAFDDLEPDGRLVFNVLILERDRAGKWSQRSTSTRLWPLRRDELVTALGNAGFAGIDCRGEMGDAPFDPQTSENLVVVGRLRG